MENNYLKEMDIKATTSSHLLNLIATSHKFSILMLFSSRSNGEEMKNEIIWLD